MIRWIRRQFDKLNGGNQFTQWGNGRWYVRYNDGNKSCSMHYITACNYADIFGGKVFHVDDKEECQ